VNSANPLKPLQATNGGASTFMSAIFEAGVLLPGILEAGFDRIRLPVNNVNVKAVCGHPTFRRTVWGML
jgi:hypothetical protein